jgi:hypothetical protein
LRTKLYFVCVLASCLEAQVINTVAGTSWSFPTSNLTALNAPLGQIGSVAVDPAGDVYAADYQTNIVAKISPTGTFSIVAGNGAATFSGDGGLAVNASLNGPGGMTIDSGGNIYIGDSGNNRVREVFSGFVAIPYQTTPTALNFSAIAGTTVPGPQTISLSSKIAGLSFTASSN